MTAGRLTRCITRPAIRSSRRRRVSRPPLLALSHGGPTGAASGALDMSVQFWTTRGFAVVDVNYGGSVGYGRAYRQLLNGGWGVVDVDDCANAALHLVHQGLADGDRLAIRGGSAGGYTTLAALTFRNVFAAGASYYGISDLEALASDTHKFESRYLDRLVAPYPEGADTYRRRSPIRHVEGLSCPIILMQGLEDRIVPPNQAEMMFDAVRAKGSALRVSALRGRTARIPTGREHQAGAGSGGLFLLQGVWIPAGRHGGASGDREFVTP